MPKVKGCPNEKCALHRKHIQFSKKDNYCSSCGSKLVFVCKNKKCYTFLEEHDGDYCLKCQAAIHDRNDAVRDSVMKAGGAALAVGGVVITKGEDIMKAVGKIIKK